MDLRTRLFLSLLLGTALVHLPALGGGFVWDDHVLLERGGDLAEPGGVLAVFGRNYFGGRASSELYRPLVNLTLLADRGFWGPGPLGYHVTNLLLHLANGLLLYLLLRRLTAKPLLPEAAALVFLVHPASAEPVAWIVARGDLLALLLTLATAHLHLSGRRRPALHALALLAYLAALFGKLAAAPAPLLILLVEWIHRGLRIRGLLAPKNLWRYGSYAVPAALYLLVRAGAMDPIFPGGVGRTWKEPELLASIFVSGAILFRSASMFALPAGFCADYSADPVSRTRELVDLAQRPLVIAAAAAAALLLVLALLRGRRSPWFSFGALWFLVALVPVSQVVRIGAVLADRFLYLPAAGAAATLAAALLAVPGPRARALLGVVAIACLAAVTVDREAVWQSDFTMNRDVLRSYPANADAWNRLGYMWWAPRGETEKEEEAYRRGLVHAPRNRYLLNNIGALLYNKERLEEARGVLELAYGVHGPDLQRAKIAANLALTYEGLGSQYREREATRELGEELLRRAALLREEARRAGVLRR